MTLIEHYAQIELYECLEAFERRNKYERIQLTAQAWNTFFETLKFYESC